MGLKVAAKISAGEGSVVAKLILNIIYLPVGYRFNCKMGY